MRKPNPTTPAALKCAQCLFRVGFGIKIAMRNTGAPQTSLKRMRRQSGIELSKRPRLNLGRVNRKAVQWMEDAWIAEWKGTQYLGELKHWRKHPEVLRGAGMDAYYADHEASKQKSKMRAAQRYKTTPKGSSVYIKRLLRSRVINAIKRNRKSLGMGRKRIATMHLVGCDVDVLIRHIAGTFKEGMTWDNHGAWHVDHIIPCASFDLSIEANQIKCFHYSNMQALWATDNIRKSDSVAIVPG